MPPKTIHLPTASQADAPKRGAINPQPLNAISVPDALLKVATVGAVTGLSSSSIFRKVAAGEFPQPVRLGKRCTRWRASLVTAWLATAGKQEGV